MLEKDKKEKHEAYKQFALLGEEQTAHDNNEEECEAKTLTRPLRRSLKEIAKHSIF